MTLLRNDGGNRNHWLTIRPVGRKSNRQGIGVKVKISAAGKTQTKEVLGGGSYLSSSDPRLHFGLGASTKVDIEVRWPLGIVAKYPSISADQFITIREGEGIVKGRPFSR